MQIAFFSSKRYDREFFAAANEAFGYGLEFFDNRLREQSAELAARYPAVCAFVNDDLSRPVLEALAAGETRLIALRCAGFNNVDLDAAAELGIKVVRVPAYSPHAVAEHVLALLLTLNRKTHRAYNRVREGNFSIENLQGFDLHGKSVGIIGTGKIGAITAGIFKGFGCRLYGYDIRPNPECEALGMEYRDLPELFGACDIISLHCPLTPDTHHVIDAGAVEAMKPGVTLINTSRGALIHTQAVIEGLKSGQVGQLALDVYEEEGDLFFEDLSSEIIQDDVFMRLLTFPNVLVTSHQAFFTREALRDIAQTTLENVRAFEQNQPLTNEVKKRS